MLDRPFPEAIRVVPDVLVNRFVSFLHQSGSGHRIGMTSLCIRLSTAINASE
jgi:hypothetical protein